MQRRTGVLVATIIVSVLGAGCGASAPRYEALRTGRSVYADNCSTCHGKRGQGGVGPALSEVRDVWPSCSDQIEWITLGSDRWQLEHGPTYGALDHTIDKVMPGFDAKLTPAEIAAVAAFERVEYGEGDELAELTACGAPVD